MKFCISFCIVFLAAGLCRAQTQPSTKPIRASTRSSTPVTVAIFDFDANLPGNPDLGKQAAEAIGALMSGHPGFRLVDRAQISKTLTEQELNLTGLVDTDKVKVGKLIGARILITGKIFTLDKSIFATAKLIGTETTLVEGVLVKAKAGGDTGELLVELSAKLQQRLTESSSKLLGADDAVVDPLPALKERLAKKAKPVVRIEVTERHIGEAQRAPDPPVDMELRTSFLACGFTVLDPAEANAKGDVLIKGEAFSEFAARVQNLHSCTGRAELSLVNVADGKVIAATRTLARAADLSENIAGRTALQRAGHEGAIQLLEKLAETLPDAK
jgi:hypothetical protein